MEVPELLWLTFPVKAQATKSLHGFPLSVRYHRNQWLHLGLWVHITAHARIVQQLIINFVTYCADKVRFFKGWSSPLRPLCALPVPPNTTQAHPVVFRLLVLTDGHCCRPDGILCFPAILFAVCYLYSLVTHFPLLCNSSHAHPLLSLQLALHLSKITTLCKSWESQAAAKSDREWTRHSHTEIPWLHWNLNSHFHSFWWAHSLWQRNQLSSAFSGS